MENILRFLALLCLVVSGCTCQKNPDDPVRIDLDSLQSLDVDFAHEYRTHKIFDALGESDTIHLSENLVSVKKATSSYRSTNPELSDVIFSRIDIRYHDRTVFSMDSILTSGMYCYDEKSNLLTIPIVLSQESDDLRTDNEIVLCDLKTGECTKINERPLSNSSFALICPDGKHLIYSNANMLYSYDLATKKSLPILEFSNPLLSIFKMDCQDGKLDVYYFNNFVEDYINDVPMQKVSIPMQKFCR